MALVEVQIPTNKGNKGNKGGRREKRRRGKCAEDGRTPALAVREATGGDGREEATGRSPR
jgi:hypothetical protein